MIKAAIGNPPVTVQNTAFKAKRGNGTFFSNNFVVALFRFINYLFIQAVHEQMIYCVVHDNGTELAYVISNNYSGEKYNELYKFQFN